MGNTERESLFCVMLLSLTKSSVGFHRYYNKGYRYVVQQLNGDSHFFKDLERAGEFMEAHGLQGVSVEEMMDLRDKAGL